MNQYIFDIEKRYIHTCIMENLLSNTTDYFDACFDIDAEIFNATLGGYVKRICASERKFKTLHNDSNADVEFISGGDWGFYEAREHV